MGFKIGSNKITRASKWGYNGIELGLKSSSLQMDLAAHQIEELIA